MYSKILTASLLCILVWLIASYQKEIICRRVYGDSREYFKPHTHNEDILFLNVDSLLNRIFQCIVVFKNEDTDSGWWKGWSKISMWSNGGLFRTEEIIKTFDNVFFEINHYYSFNMTTFEIVTNKYIERATF